MTSEGMRVDPDSLMASGDGLLSSAGRIRDEITAFQGELAGFGEPWGQDDLGSLIGMVYQTISDLAVECYLENTVEVDETGAATRVMATEYQNTEDANTDQARRIADALGGW